MTVMSLADRVAEAQENVYANYTTDVESFASAARTLQKLLDEQRKANDVGSGTRLLAGLVANPNRVRVA